MPDRAPADPVPHPSVFVVDEMEARGWDRDTLALAMAGGDTGREFGACRIALDLYLDIGPGEKNLRIPADLFARAFGTSPQYWANLERAWLHAQPATERAGEDGG